MDWEVLYSDILNINGFNCHGYTSGGIEKGLARIEEKIKKISEIGKMHGAKIYLLVYPWPAQLKYKSKFDWPDHISKLCEEISCEKTINTFPDFMREDYVSAYKKYFVQDDVRYNKNGNLIVANAILRSIKH